MLPKEVTKKITGLHHFIKYICDSNKFLYLVIDQMLSPLQITIILC
jgi:hypothetical protein